jgi:hypothetical protein
MHSAMPQTEPIEIYYSKKAYDFGLLLRFKTVCLS